MDLECFFVRKVQLGTKKMKVLVRESTNRQQRPAQTKERIDSKKTYGVAPLDAIDCRNMHLLTVGPKKKGSRAD